MYKKLLAFSVMLCMAPFPAMAETFSDVMYIEGLPGFSDKPEAGTLQVESNGITFARLNGQACIIPFPNLREHLYESKTENSRARGFAIAGPNPILLASSLGLSLLGNALYRPKEKSEHYYKVRFLGEGQALREVIFQVRDQATQRAIFERVQTASREALNNAMKEFQTPLQNHPQSPPLELPTEIDSGQADPAEFEHDRFMLP